MKFNKTPLAIAIVCAMSSVGVSTAYAVPEIEDNNTFADRNVLDSGVRTYEGELSPGAPFDPFGGDTFFEVFTPDYIFSGESLISGEVDSFSISGLASTDRVDIIVDNTPQGSAINDAFMREGFGEFGGGEGPDTVLGVFDEGGNIFQTDDDSSPAGDGFGDAVFDAHVQPDGTVDFKVSGYDDFDFDGAHPEAGDYDVGVYLNRDGSEFFNALSDAGLVFGDGELILGDGELGGGEGNFGMVEGDVDFVQFTGLTPGDIFSVELFADLDSQLDDTGGMIGLFNDFGALIAADRGWDGQTIVGGIVPTSGNVNVAVTGIGDDGNFDDGVAFNGASFGQESGLYDLALDSFSLGDPGAGNIGDIVELPLDPESNEAIAICDGATDCFAFGGLEIVEGQIVNLDPDVATGYDYAITSGPGFFSTVVLPNVGADTEFVITVGGVDFIVFAGDLFTFDPSVTNFSVSGIDPAEMLDSSNPIAFVAAATFSVTGTYDISQTAQTQPHSSAVPEPGMLALFGAGLAGLGFVGRKRKKA